MWVPSLRVDAAHVSTVEHELSPKGMGRNEEDEVKDADYQRRRRAAARAKGMCGSCATKRAEPGFACCASCRQRYLDRGKDKEGVTVRSHRAPALPWCMECQVFGPHRPGCPVTGTPASFRRASCR